MHMGFLMNRIDELAKIEAINEMYFSGMALVEIAEVLNLSREFVCQIISEIESEEENV